MQNDCWQTQTIAVTIHESRSLKNYCAIAVNIFSFQKCLRGVPQNSTITISSGAYWPLLCHHTSSLFWRFQPVTCGQGVMETQIKAIIALPPWGDKDVVSLLTIQDTLKYPWGTFVSYWYHKCQILRDIKIVHFKLSYYGTHSTCAEEWILKFILSPRSPGALLGEKGRGGFCRISRGLKTCIWHSCGTVTTWLVPFHCTMQCFNVRENTLSFNIPMNGHTLKKEGLWSNSN